MTLETNSNDNTSEYMNLKYFYYFEQKLVFIISFHSVYFLYGFSVLLIIHLTLCFGKYKLSSTIQCIIKNTRRWSLEKFECDGFPY